MRLTALLVFCCCLLLWSCQRYEPQQFIREVDASHSPFKVSKEFPEKNLRLELVFKPAEYHALMEAAGNDHAAEVYEKVLPEHEQSLQFDFRISALNYDTDILKDTLDPRTYQDRITYFTTQAGQDFTFLINGDSVLTELFHFERTYNVIPYNNFLLGIGTGRAELRTDLILVYHDRQFGLGPVEFVVPKSLIKKTYSITL